MPKLTDHRSLETLSEKLAADRSRYAKRVVVSSGTCGEASGSLAVVEAFRSELARQGLAEDALAEEADGVLLSNGPSDPEPVEYGIRAAKELLGKLPVFGICLGHQIMGLAFGGKTCKLKFGHHGSNHPVKDLATGRIQITAQNHGFCVEAESLSGHDVKLTHVNLNDRTVEGGVYRGAGGEERSRSIFALIPARLGWPGARRSTSSRQRIASSR